MANLIGQSFRRKEDHRFVTGTGQYVADIRMDNMAEAAFIRSTYAHARIKSIDRSAALAMDDVYAVITGEDLVGKVGLMSEMESHCRLPKHIEDQIKPIMKHNVEPVLATGKVKYVGQNVVCIVAKNRYIAEDAAALVKIDYEPLPAVVDPFEALKEGAPLVQDDLDDNMQAYFHLPVGSWEEAVSKADHVIKGRFTSPRVGSNPIETRGVVASYDNRTDFLNIWSSTQMPFEIRHYVAKLLGLVEQNIRVVAPDVGGGFGPKGGLYPEEVLLAYLAKQLKRPVRWIEDRMEHMSGARHSRDQIHDLEVAYTKDGTILGVKDDFVLDVGAINYFALTCAYNSAAHFRGAYKIPVFDLTCRIALTNKTPNVPYRGAGRPEVVFAMDRIVDLIARELGMDPVEVMLKNIIPAEEMPYSQGMYYKDGGELIYDSGNYPEAFEMALEMSRFKEIRANQEQWRKEGTYIGIGFSSNVEGTGVGPFEGAKVSIDPSGQVILHVGSSSQGQSHETVFGQVAGDVFGVSLDRVTVKNGDTVALGYGAGTYASRSAVNAGSAAHLASVKLREKMLAVAGNVLEIAPEELTMQDGVIFAVSQPEKKITFPELAAAATPGMRCKVPEGMDPGLEATHYFVPPTVTYSSSVHAAVVEVDIETGFVKIRNYYIVHDSGRVINPMVVEGQVQGGFAQGIGTALYEEVVHNENGQLLTGTYMDYLLPTSMEVPVAVQGEQEYYSTRNPLGVKGVGESGAISTPAAIANAVVDALAPFHVKIDRLPVSPNRVFDLLQDAQSEEVIMPK